MDKFLPLFVVCPLISAALCILFPRSILINRTLLVVTPLGSLICSAVALKQTLDGDVLVAHIGGWIPGVAISFAADTFSSLVLITTTILILVCNLFSLASRDSDERYFAPLVLILLSAVGGALLTADIFNFFVFFELMFLPGCGLVVLRKGLERLQAPRLYVTFNLLSSLILVVGIALVYGETGTVNLAQLSGRASESVLTASAAGVMFISLCMKAAVFPFHGWLARTYPATSPVVTAIFSGLHTKVAIYALYRLYSVMFDGSQTYLPFFTAILVLTMAIGAFGALGENTVRSILTFHMVSQIGYILLGVALFGELGLMAGVFYLIHHMIVKASLLLSAAAIEETYGTGRLKKLAGLATHHKLLSVAFFCAALSLAGVPPFSGFISKLTMMRAAIDVDNKVAAIAIVAVSLVTLMSMLKIWSSIFWSHQDPKEDVHSELPMRLTLVLPGFALMTISLAIGLYPDFLMDLSQHAAQNLLDTSGYVEAVLSP